MKPYKVTIHFVCLEKYRNLSVIHSILKQLIKPYKIAIHFSSFEE